MNSREKMLIGMNEIITSLNNEEAIAPWLMYGVPDGSSEEDICEIANTDEFFEMASLFLRIIKKPIAWNDGVYVDKRVVSADE